jgi:uncharacterized protein with PIN domain
MPGNGGRTEWPMRLMCDEMLHGLGRWLRAAGYDTAIAAGGVADRDLVRRCAAERRILLTRDRHLAAAAQGQTPLVIVGGGSIADAARGVAQALAIDWLHAPFTRCLVDNTPLEPAPPEMAAEVPQRSRAVGGPLRLCPLCRRLYWPGGHVRRMQARLAEWASQANGLARRGQ